MSRLEQLAAAIELEHGVEVAGSGAMAADAHLTAVRRTARAAREALERRDDAIARAALERGHSLRTIAEAAQLSHSGVAKIVERKLDTDQGDTTCTAES